MVLPGPVYHNYCLLEQGGYLDLLLEFQLSVAHQSETNTNARSLKLDNCSLSDLALISIAITTTQVISLGVIVEGLLTYVSFSEFAAIQGNSGSLSLQYQVCDEQQKHFRYSTVPGESEGKMVFYRQSLGSQ